MANQITIDAIEMTQPMGDFYVGVMAWQDLRQISFADMRRIDNELDTYIGIQRKLNPGRIKEIGQFVNTIDATFPTSVVLAIPGKCASFDRAQKKLTIKENLDTSDGTDAVQFQDIAQILDGQHRIEGLSAFKGDKFEIPVTILVNADISDQAYIFATVNLAQTKVNPSLVYDLLDYARARSPQKTCHEIAVALNSHISSPFKGMIKRLGDATPGATAETITQSTFVKSLLPFISKDEVSDRDLMLRGKTPSLHQNSNVETPFRYLFLLDEDHLIAKNIVEYFSAVATKWPVDWRRRERGQILPRTNGFRAFMRLLKPAYINLRQSSEEKVFDRDEYIKFFANSTIPEGGFNTDVYPPGTSGEKKLYDQLMLESGLLFR